MYHYFEGLVIREGTKGIPAEYVEELFKDAVGVSIHQTGRKRSSL